MRFRTYPIFDGNTCLAPGRFIENYVREMPGGHAAEIIELPDVTYIKQEGQWVWDWFSAGKWSDNPKAFVWERICRT